MGIMNLVEAAARFAAAAADIEIAKHAAPAKTALTRRCLRRVR